MSNKAVAGADGKLRCSWCMATEQYLAYHDTEWGFPVDDDRRLFEKLCLEGFQSGLSWRTILEKRENFRAAFDGFDFRRIAQYTESDVERLMANAGIIRHRGKVAATINNARRAIEMVETEGSLATFLWRYEPDQPRAVGAVLTPLSGPTAAIPAVEAVIATTSPESVALSKELKKRGWKFVGPTTIYSFMQAMGMVNDHDPRCFMREEVERARNAFVRP